MIDNNLELIQQGGKGASSIVYHVKDVYGNDYAAKCIRKEKKYEASKAVKFLIDEFLIMKQIEEHPNILKPIHYNLEGVADVDGIKQPVMYNLLEYAENGALDRIIQFTGPLEEEISRFIMLQIGHALKHIHSKRVAHLDIKPSNIFFDKYFNVKIGDFGISEDVSQDDGYITSRKGTPGFMAPEISEGVKQNLEYDAYAADIYSLGITLFTMVTGKLLKTEETFINLLTYDTIISVDEKVITEKLSKKDGRFNWMSKELKDGLCHMIEEDPFSRLTITDIMEDSWLSKPFSENILEEVYSELMMRNNYIKSIHINTFHELKFE